MTCHPVFVVSKVVYYKQRRFRTSRNPVEIIVCYLIRNRMLFFMQTSAVYRQLKSIGEELLKY